MNVDLTSSMAIFSFTSCLVLIIGGLRILLKTTRHRVQEYNTEMFTVKL